jgi:two-component system sensor kinase FixL
MLAHVSRLSAMGEMAAALAHELNQPLTAVGNSVGAIEMMLTGSDKPIDDIARGRIVRAAKHAQTQAVRAGEIVRRLREFVSRGEADTKAENLERLVDDALALALPNPASARVEIRLELGRDARGILADRVQIEQVLVNLIRNAVESMRDQETQRILTIGSLVQQDMVAVRVKDTGPGVSSEVADRLFSPFQSTKADGMGVGLSICRRIVEAHGGRMWLEPSDDGGADFRFTLTLYRPEPNHGER